MTATGNAAQTASRDEIAAFRAQCTEVRNSALAALCTAALTGDTEATARVTSIIRTGADLPATGDRAAKLAALRAAHGL
jgi:hypothetical protein